MEPAAVLAALAVVEPAAEFGFLFGGEVWYGRRRCGGVGSLSGSAGGRCCHPLKIDRVVRMTSTAIGLRVAGTTAEALDAFAAARWPLDEHGRPSRNSVMVLAIDHALANMPAGWRPPPDRAPLSAFLPVRVSAQRRTALEERALKEGFVRPEGPNVAAMLRMCILYLLDSPPSEGTRP